MHSLCSWGTKLKFTIMKLAEIINVIEHNEQLRYEDIKPRIKQLSAYFIGTNNPDLFFTPLDSYGIYGIISTNENLDQNIEQYLNELCIGNWDSEEYQNERELLIFNTVIL